MDITMCSGDNCQKKESCYRFTALPNDYWQAVFIDVPVDLVTQECEHYWNNYVDSK
jgi:hypothetical protein